MKKTTIIASVIAFAPVIAPAQTFGEIVDAIADASPAVSAIDADGLAAEAALKGANLLEGPELEAERLYAPAGGEHRWSAGISQTLPVPGQFSRTSQAMQALRRRNLAAAEAARAEVSVSTRRLLIDYIAAKADRELTHRIALSATELLEKYSRAFEAGEATIIDLNKTRIEAARANAADAQAEAQLEGYRAEIRAIAPDDATAEAALALTDYPPVTELPPLPQVIARYETSPKAMLAIAEADYAHATASLAATELWPRLGVGYAHAYEEGTHYNGFTVSLKLPAWGARNTGHTVAQQQALSTQFAAQQTRAEAMAEIGARYAETASLARQLDELAPAVAIADNFGLLRRALDGGELTLLAYLQETQYFIEAQRQYIALARDHAAAMAILSPYL